MNFRLVFCCQLSEPHVFSEKITYEHRQRIEELCIQAYTKKDLYKINPSAWSAAIEVARDKLNREGKVVKTYLWYRSLGEFIDGLVEMDPDTRWYYEVIPGDMRTPMYFDIDIDNIR